VQPKKKKKNEGTAEEDSDQEDIDAEQKRKRELGRVQTNSQPKLQNRTIIPLEKLQDQIQNKEIGSSQI
jgi:hypothetical protein